MALASASIIARATSVEGFSFAASAVAIRSAIIVICRSTASALAPLTRNSDNTCSRTARLWCLLELTIAWASHASSAAERHEFSQGRASGRCGAFPECQRQLQSHLCVRMADQCSERSQQRVARRDPRLRQQNRVSHDSGMLVAECVKQVVITQLFQTIERPQGVNARLRRRARRR